MHGGDPESWAQWNASEWTKWDKSVKDDSVDGGRCWETRIEEDLAILGEYGKL